MSIFTPFIKIWDKVKALLSDIPAHLTPLIADAVAITSEIRQALASNVAIAITSIIPGTWDDAIREQLIAILNQVIPLLGIEQTCGADLNCWATEIAKLPQDVQDALLLKLAAKIVGALDGNKLPQNLYDLYTQAHISGSK